MYVLSRFVNEFVDVPYSEMLISVQKTGLVEAIVRHSESYYRYLEIFVSFHELFSAGMVRLRILFLHFLY